MRITAVLIARMIVLVVMVKVFVLHLFLHLWRFLVELVLDDLLLLDDGRFVMVMDTFDQCVGVFLRFYLDRNMDDDFSATLNTGVSVVDGGQQTKAREE
jgi:hypothetical protein